MAGHRPALIILQGAPGVGKTTLARRLAHDVDVPQIGKDDIKELLFDRMGTGDREWSRVLGTAVSRMLYPLVDTVLAEGRDVIVESAFYSTFAAVELGAIIAKQNARCLEIYCSLEPGERRRRFVARNARGERHPGHLDADSTELADEITKATYAPLSIGELYRVDTMHLGEQEYDTVRQRVIKFLAA